MNTYLENRKKEIDSLLNVMKSIEFRSYDSNPRARLSVDPLPDGVGWYLGVDTVDTKLINTGKPYVNPKDPDNAFSRYIIRHKSVLDLTLPGHVLIAKWLLFNDRISLSYEDGASNKLMKFYIYNRDAVVKQQAEEFDTTYKAMETLKSLSHSDIMEIALVLGISASNYTDDELRNMLYNKYIKSTPNKFLEAVSDSQRNIKAFVKTAVEKQIIKVGKKGEYYFGEFFLGKNFDEVVGWIRNANMDPTNSKLLQELKSKI